MTTGAAVRVHVAGHVARIVANRPAVCEWVARYFGSWSHVETEPHGAGVVDVNVLAHVDDTRFAEIRSAVDAVEHEVFRYGRTDLRVAHTGGAVVAYGADRVAYTVVNRSIAIAGTDPDLVAAAACRSAQDAVRGLLARAGWVLLHASAVVLAGRAYVAFGPTGTGKTALALQLARATGGALLADDRVLARPDADGTVVVLPWPAAAAVGLGLLDAAGWYDAVATARDELHPSTTAAVLAALTRGERAPVRDGEREHTAQLFPDQVTTLLGLPLASGAAASTLLFPTADPAATPTVRPGGRVIGVGDMFAGTKDRYPDVFGLRAAEPDTAHGAVFEALNALPRLTITLGHDVGANLAVLGDIG